MPSPFDFVKSINNKEYIFEENLDKKDYTAYIVNKVFSFFPDTIYLVNEINQYPSVEPKQHYDFLYNVVSKKNRYSKWVKSTKDDTALAISKALNIRYERAIEIMDTLDEEKLSQLIDSLTIIEG
jgi:hypothetical protein